jgi:predicted nucleotidyltransferase
LDRHRLELKRFSVRSIALFGSYAKGAQTDSSDLDFVVEFSVPTYNHCAGLSAFPSATHFEEIKFSSAGSL